MEISENTQNRINLLPEHLIDQIKAGEVVERPANVLKELLENSIDANSTKVRVTIINAGLDLIAIEDNGDGMFFDELPYAFCRHATSKINNFEDIYRLNTFGFRGEALASISSVARISCHSAPRSNPEEGAKYVIHGARTVEHSKYSTHKCGTSTYVKDLFFNTPVRLKFVKSGQSEKNALKRVINSFLINYPQVEFSITWDDQDPDIYRAQEHTVNRVGEIFKKKSRKNRPEILQSYGEYLGSSCQFYISKDASKGYSGKQQFLFVNNRLFTDKKIHQIIIRNMEKFWPQGLTGDYIMQFKVPENEIDVNVHPNKTIIKFLKSNEIFSLTSATAKKLISENQDHITENHSLEMNEEEANFNSLSSALFNQGADNIVADNFGGGLNLQRFQNELNQSTDFHGQSSLFGENASGQQSELTISALGENVFLFNHVERGPYFVDAQVFLDEACEQIDIDNMTPLLISEPISKDISDMENLAQYMTMGIEIERLDGHTCVLRSVSHVFEDLPYAKIATNIINGSELLEDLELQVNEVRKLLSFTSFYDLVEKKIAKKISPKKLRKLLK
ncbi:DNA mismatch repair endonuclease MutL [Halobacteriovorax sp. HFRX-2_2]|uniref:DNA mismatch repair endonuclease MutL n=1 Tax=unclassified Halobacteriovorax TaxID=2639665 RepID=UPI00371F288E